MTNLLPEGIYFATTKEENFSIYSSEEFGDNLIKIPVELTLLDRTIYAFLPEGSVELQLALIAGARSVTFLVKISHQIINGVLQEEAWIDFSSIEEKISALTTGFSDSFTIKTKEFTSEYYILDVNNKPVPSNSTDAIIFRDKNFDKQVRVGFDKVGEIEISTVFLGVNHNFSKKGPPIFWETMVKGMLDVNGEPEFFIQRYSSYEEAVKGHKAALLIIQKYSTNNNNKRTLIIDSL